jgi:hypothetical protein
VPQAGRGPLPQHGRPPGPARKTATGLLRPVTPLPLGLPGAYQALSPTAQHHPPLNLIASSPHVPLLPRDGGGRRTLAVHRGAGRPGARAVAHARLPPLCTVVGRRLVTQLLLSFLPVASRSAGTRSTAAARRSCPELSPAEQADAATCIPASHMPPHLLAKSPSSVHAAAPLPLRPSPSLPSVSPQHGGAAPPRALPCRCARWRTTYSPSVSITARRRSGLWAAWAPVGCLDTARWDVGPG